MDRSSRARLVFIDAIRAAACLAVVVFHALCTTELQPGLRGAIPAGVWKVTGLLGFRVQTLFLLSGFLAALSLRRIDGSWRSAGASLLRRQARLAPAYWAMIGIGLALGSIERWRSLIPMGPGPGVGDVLANVFYLQGVVPGTIRVVDVAWTLCIDVQFYAAFILLRLVVARGYRALGRDVEGAEPASLGVVVVLGVVSMFVAAPGQNPWLPAHWYLFAMGIVAYRALFGTGVERHGWWLLAAPLAIGIWRGYPGMFGAAGVGLGIVAVGRAGRLASWGAGRVTQYFAERSYSLYLVHLPVVYGVVRIGRQVTGANVSWALVWMAASVAASIAAMQVFHALVERPLTQLVRRGVSLPKRGERRAGVELPAFTQAA